MVQQFQFGRERIERFLGALKGDKPVNNGRPWTRDDLFTLAGCAQMLLITTPTPDVDPNYDLLHGETREHIVTKSVDEVLAVVRYLTRTAAEVAQGRYRFPDGSGAGDARPTSCVARWRA